jgi:hypothetical protein
MAVASVSGGSIVQRMVGAARLDIPTYEEVEADSSATNQALTVVVLGALATGIGAAIGAMMAGAGGNVVGPLIGGVVRGLIGYAIWSYVIFFVGTKMFGGTATWGETLRTLGFASSVQILTILSFVPVVGGILALVVGIWGMVTSFIATRQALDISNGKTFGAIIVSFIVLVIVMLILSPIFALIGLASPMPSVPMT